MTALKATLTTLALALPALPAFAAQTFETDQGHTEVRMSWSHAGVSVQTGEFTTANGTLTLDADAIANSSVSVTIDAASVASGFKPLDDHLKSPDFLNVEKFPTITFESTEVKQTGDTTADVTGNLTIHGVTKPVTLATTLTHRGPHPLGQVIDYYKGEWVAFSASTQIDHMEFGVGAFSTGPITIEISTEMREKK